jgi:hypothetical protein
MQCESNQALQEIQQNSNSLGLNPPSDAWVHKTMCSLTSFHDVLDKTLTILKQFQATLGTVKPDIKYAIYWLLVSQAALKIYANSANRVDAKFVLDKVQNALGVAARIHKLEKPQCGGNKFPARSLRFPQRGNVAKPQTRRATKNINALWKGV